MKFLLIILIVSSCSTGLRVKSGTCTGSVGLKKKTETSHGSSTFIYRRFGFGKQNVDMDELLQEAKAPECKRVKRLSLAIESDFFDQVVSLIPLVSQWSISMKWDEVSPSGSK